MPAKYRMPIRRSPKADPQQYRVYRMENEAIGSRHYRRLSRRGIRTLIRSVCRDYGVAVPRIVWKDLGRWSAEWSTRAGTEKRTISFSTRKKMSRDMLTVTHELAHHLHYEFAGLIADKQENHGPQFMACHMSILDTCRIIPIIGMRAICDAWRIRYVDPGTTRSPAKLKRVITRT